MPCPVFFSQRLILGLSERSRQPIIWTTICLNQAAIELLQPLGGRFELLEGITSQVLILLLLKGHKAGQLVEELHRGLGIGEALFIFQQPGFLGCLLTLAEGFIERCSGALQRIE